MRSSVVLLYARWLIQFCLIATGFSAPCNFDGLEVTATVSYTLGTVTCTLGSGTLITGTYDEVSRKQPGHRPPTYQTALMIKSDGGGKTTLLITGSGSKNSKIIRDHGEPHGHNFYLFFVEAGAVLVLNSLTVSGGQPLWDVEGSTKARNYKIGKSELPRLPRQPKSLNRQFNVMRFHSLGH